MATPVLYAADIFDPDLLTLPEQRPAPAAHPSSGAFSGFQHPEAGQIHLKSTEFPHLQVLDMRWQTGKDDFELHDPTACEGVSINFVLNGVIDSRFRGLNHELPMRARTHNLIHTPETGHTNRIKGGQGLSMLLIDLKKDFFMSSIGQDDAWSERVLNDLAHDRPFSGVRGVQTITPQMNYLIDDIRHCQVTGPMRNLLIQSRVLELVALEVDQFRTPIGVSQTIPVDEVEKLYQLKAYLEISFLEDHSLAHLSRYCALNEFKVKKGFRALFDTTVFNYLRKLRMDYAGQLLRNSAVTVDEVADRLGYEHSQHFSIAFKKYTGLTPSQYQQGRQRPVAIPTLVAA